MNKRQITDKLFRPIACVMKLFVAIRSEEQAKTCLMFLYFFLIITLNWMLKPVQKSLFMAEFGADKIRYVNIGEGIFLFFIASGYIAFAKAASAKKFYYGILTFFMAGYGVLWYLLHLKTPWVSVVFWLWQACSTITLATAFWTLANDIFNVQEAKRIFGVMISGGSIGGVVGSMLTNRLVQWVQTEDIVLVGALITGLCLVVLRALLREIPQFRLTDPAKVESEDIQEAPASKGFLVDVFKIFFKSRYLLMLAALVMIPKIASTIIDNQFSAVVEESISGKEAITAYFGKFGVWLNLITFFSQVLGTGFLLQSLGVGFSTWILPLGLGVLTFVTCLGPTLFISTVLRLFDLSTNYSVQQASKEVFYLPLTSEIRRRVKPIIDMLGFRVAKSLAGIYIAVCAFLFHLPNNQLNLLVLAMIPFWILLVWHMRKHYVKLLRKNLLKGKKLKRTQVMDRPTDVFPFLYDEKNFHEVKALMNHRLPSVRKMAATLVLAYSKPFIHSDPIRSFMTQTLKEEERDGMESGNPYELSEQDLQFYLRLCGEDPTGTSLNREELKENLKKSPESILIKLGDVFRDSSNGKLDKRHACRILEFIPRQESADLLLQNLAATQDHALRGVMLRSLNRLHDKNRKFKVNRFLVKNEIIRELKIYEEIRKVVICYQRTQKALLEELVFPQVLLNALLDESLERLFDYLDLLYPFEKVQLIRDELIGNDGNVEAKAHAIELLHNILDTGLWLLIQRIFENPENLMLNVDEVKNILKKYLTSSDRWFSLLAKLMTHELGMQEAAAQV